MGRMPSDATEGSFIPKPLRGAAFYNGSSKYFEGVTALRVSTMLKPECTLAELVKWLGMKL